MTDILPFWLETLKTKLMIIEACIIAYSGNFPLAYPGGSKFEPRRGCGGCPSLPS